MSGRIILATLCLAAAAFVPSRAVTQVPVDTTMAETERRDTLTQPRDTLVSAFARAELPGTVGINESYRWYRPHFFGTGAVTLLDLLERIPGVTTFHTGWLASPMHATHLGNAGRVRVFLDGVELVPIDPQLGIVADLHDVPLHALDEVSVERGADEVRVYARSWTLVRTTTFTRTDFETGDANTNLYRAFAGRRWRNGVGVQGALEQYATSAPAGRGGGDQLTLQARAGWARDGWSADAFVLNARQTRDEHPRLIGTGGMERFRANRRLAYARVGYGSPGDGGWVQLTGVTRSFRPERQQPPGTPPEEQVRDTTYWHGQFVAAGGLSVGNLRLSATNRLHAAEGETRNAFEGRALFGAGPLSLALRTERRAEGWSSVEEATAALAPLSFIGVSAAVARRTPGLDAMETDDVVTARVEGALRLGSLWLSGGAVRRGGTRVQGLRVFDEEYLEAVDSEATGIIAGARGLIWRGVGVSAWMIRWEEAGWYRPQLQTHTEIFVRTLWLDRFPRGNLEIFASVAHHHRSTLVVPRVGEGDILAGADAIQPLDYFTGRLEVRLLDAVLFWQQRLFTTLTPQIVPGYVPLQTTSFFGLRWNFWN